METLVSSEGMEGKEVKLSLHQLSKEEKWGYFQEDRAFVDSILNSTPAMVTAHDGYKSVELVDACYRAVNTRERIIF
jgi:predicted dehydrogenase